MPDLRGGDNVDEDIKRGKKFADKILGEDFKLSRLRDQENIKDVRERLDANTKMSDKERLARRESVYGTIGSAEQTQNRNLLRTLAASGVRGGAAGGAIQGLASSQARGRREAAQNLYLQEQQMMRQGLRDYAQFELDTTKYDIGQEQSELTARTQTQLAGMNLYANERSAIRQAEAALKAAQAQSGGGKK